MFAKDLDDRLTAHGPLSGPPPHQREQFKTLVTESAQLTIAPKRKVHQDWFDENNERIKELLDDKKKTFIEWQNVISSTSKGDRFKHLQRRAQTALRRMQDEWWEKKVDEIETYSCHKELKKMFFSVIQEVDGLTKPRTTPLLSADGSTLLKEKSSTHARWRVHFSTLLNRPSTVDLTVLDQIPRKPAITSLDLPPPPPPTQTCDEFSKAIKNSLGWTGFLPRSSNQPAQWPSKHSTHSSPASRKKRMCPQNSGMPQSSPCSRTGAEVTAATTGASLSCPSLGRSGLGYHQPPHHQHIGGKPAGSSVWIPSKPQHHFARCRSASNRIWTSLPSS